MTKGPASGQARLRSESMIVFDKCMLNHKGSMSEVKEKKYIYIYLTPVSDRLPGEITLKPPEQNCCLFHCYAANEMLLAFTLVLSQCVYS